MDLTVAHRARDLLDVTVVTLSGQIDVFTSPRLRESLLDVIEAGHIHLVIDLSEVDFLDSTGLGVLVGVFHRLRTRGGAMHIVGGSARVRRVFHVTQLNRILPIHDSEEAAFKALAG